MIFRPCLDLHQGKVKQIVGSTLSNEANQLPVVNFETEKSPADYASLYCSDGLTGGHVICLGPGNEQAAKDALTAYPQGLQLGGGMNAENACFWLEQGASELIFTSWIFRDGKIDYKRLEELCHLLGRKRIVLDLSCRKRNGVYQIVTDRWTKFSDEPLNFETLKGLSKYCSEFLVHAVDVEGKQSGIEKGLFSLFLGFDDLPITYAGGIRDYEDLDFIEQVGRGRIDFTVGSGLDIFGGKNFKYNDLTKKYGSLQNEMAGGNWKI